MNCILFFGDSFCASTSSEKNHWPCVLSRLLKKNMKAYCYGGGSWATVLRSIKKLNELHFENSDIVVFCHTQYNRIPSYWWWEENHLKPSMSIGKREDLRNLYYKHFIDHDFLDFCESRWFEWLGKHFEGKKLVHLHSFDESLSKIDLLTGINITPSLSSISLKEENVKTVLDYRENHLSKENNILLAHQLFDIISNNNEGTFELDLSKFKLNNV